MSSARLTQPKRWTPAEDEQLRDLCNTDANYESIARSIGRSLIAVRHRASRLGIKRDRLAQFSRHSKLLRDRFDAMGEPRDIGAWKRRVFERDNYTCVDCDLHCPSICHAHHVIQRVDAPSRVFDVSNGVTLCPNCHATRHLHIGKSSSGRRLSQTQRDYVYQKTREGRARLEIASALGVNIKTVAAVVKVR